MDLANRRAMAGFATAIWAIPDGASALPELGAFRSDRASIDGAG